MYGSVSHNNAETIQIEKNLIVCDDHEIWLI